VTCSADQVLSADTAGTNFNGSCTNAAGLTTIASPITIKLDKTAPDLSLPGNITKEAAGPSGASVTYSASVSDNLDTNVVDPGCSPISGSTFPIGSKTVNCSATDEAGNTANDSFQILIQETNAPVIELHADVYAETDSSDGKVINYTNPFATDVVDGSVPVNCSPASGSRFAVGYTLVTCTATDSHGNSATSSFGVLVKERTSSASTASPSTSSALIIPLTSGELIQLDCNSVFWAFGIKLSFFNLCDQQTTVHNVSASDLPANLPAGFSFVMGLQVDVLANGQIINDLPNGSGLELDFPFSQEAPNQFAVLYWSDEDGNGRGEWIEISMQINKKQIPNTLNIKTDKSGIFILVKK
jgi:hypothetical protein